MTEIGNVYASRARFISVEEGFNIKRPELAPTSFDAERDRALSPEEPTGFILLDKSEVLGTSFPATSPLLLAKFLRIREGEAVEAQLKASGEIYHVVCGQGRTSQNGATLNWGPGDIFCLPGGLETEHRSLEGDCVLYSVTDEPMIAFERVVPAARAEAPIEAVHYPAEMIAAELAALYERELDDETPGRALFLTSDRMAAERTCLPSLTLTLNAVLPGESQRSHKHNAAAIVFITKEGSCHSVIGGQILPWTQSSVLLTPSNVPHSHLNDGGETAVALIVQDGGLHYHCRTMGFEFA